jgi:3-hydroxyisobutyrate dehydrogenase-like beta-hydroxyacid dehydrogenase
MIKSVAVIGVGAMGAPMAQRIQAAGFDLTVCDSREEALVPFIKSGTNIARSPADCAACDVVAIVVATPEQLRSVVLGSQGVRAGIAAQRSSILAVMSTVPARDLQELQRAVRPLGLDVIDAPVSGGVRRAEEGTLAIMTGGDPNIVELVRPVLASMGTHIFHCGGVGAAQTMKIVNNILGIANAVIAGEAYRLALENGLDPALVSQVLEVSTGRNFASAEPAGPASVYASMTRSRAGFDSLVSIVRKDIGLAAELASIAAGEYPAVASILALVEVLGDETYANWRRVGGIPAGCV